MDEFKSQKIKSVIKSLLKKKEIKYEELAERLECSIPTIKRILGPEELSLNRLLHLCEIVDIDLAELEGLTKIEKTKIENFTADQEIFLSKNKSYFSYLLKLFEGLSPKQIAQANNLTSRSTDKYLLHLEKQGLIRVTGTQKVKPAFKSMPDLGHGLIAKAYFESLIGGAAKFFTQFISDALHSVKEREKDKRAPGGYSLNARKITRASYVAWHEEQMKAFQNLDRISDFETKAKDPSELMTFVAVYGHALVDEDYAPLKNVDTAMGEIVNL